MTNMIATIWEEFELPSKGMVYDVKDFNYRGKIRSMTTAEELKRSSPSDTPYKIMCDIIEDCLQEKFPIHVTDLCISDYQYLVHKLRIITYGPNYKMMVTCPYCGETSEVTANLDEIEVKEWEDSMLDLRHITLPVSNYEIELRYTTPKDLDRIAYKNKEMKKKTKSPIDYSLLFTTMSLIKKVNGVSYNQDELQNVVMELPMQDVNFIVQSAKTMINALGLESNVIVKCNECLHELLEPFRISNEYWSPTL